ncbi:MAG: DDE domain-containing protein [Desulfarculus sp.]|nr:MAG: DDE domain-containing protein [Desulfarculus sp.]
MNRLPLAKRVQILNMLVEGSSMRAISRVVGCSINTINKLLVDAGNTCLEFHDKMVQGVKSRRIQCDEIWSYYYAKQKNVPKSKQGEAGDIWTWTAIDADSKLICSWLVGDRSAETGYAFMQDLATRLATRVQLTTDGHKAYLEAVEGAFGADIDFAMLVKMYGSPPEAEKRYSPPEVIGCAVTPITGKPDPKHISTSYAERQNLTMRMSMRRFTRLTNAFSKKLENHCHALALYFTYYNFIRVHKTLRVTPAMEAGLIDHLMTFEDLVALIDQREAQLKESN